VSFKQMLRRRQINQGPQGRSMRLLLGVADAVRWPFERLAWLVERRLLWPLQQRFAGWGPPRSAAGAAALGALAVAAVAVGVLWPSGGKGSPEQAATSARVAIVTPAPQPRAEKPQGPALHGVAPSFGVGKGVGVSKPAGGDASAADSEAPATELEAGSETPLPEEAAAATSSSAKPVPAGPAAMKVARRFSEAFVFYEIGERAARAKAVFDETATPQLADALGERPPRLPADAKVPKARVVNLVPGPRAGKAYTVSVSLLRVGLTSELRLELNKKSGSWVVTDVRG
jgi:hypothetical protein